MKTVHMIPSVICVSAMMFLAGCQSSKEVKPKEFTAVPLYMAGQEIPGDDQEKYLYNPSVKMYSVGRLVDSDSGVMREAGTIYRIETAPKWNLIPQYDANPESFARKKYQEQYADSAAGQVRQSLALSREIRQEQADTKDELARLEENCRKMREADAELRELIRKNNEDSKIAIENMKLMQQYIRKLESSIEDLKIRNFGGRK